MELAAGEPLFTRFACDDFAEMADLLEEAVEIMRKRTRQLRGIARRLDPSVDDPLIVIVVDELAALTAYLPHRETRNRIKEALSLLLSQGRAVGITVIVALQDPRKEILPFRDLFPTRIALRLTEAEQVDMVLGDGARDRGALADQIPPSLPGVGFVALDGTPEPMRVRFSHITDDDIHHLSHTYQRRLQPIEGSKA